MEVMDLILGCPIKGHRGIPLHFAYVLAVVALILAGQTGVITHLAFVPYRELIAETVECVKQSLTLS